jgi:hypothetical protein
MDDKTIRKRIAEALDADRIDDRLWQVLTELHPKDVQDARDEDDGALSFLIDLCNKHLRALEIYGNAPVPAGAVKLRHIEKSLGVETELRAQAVWSAQLDRALKDSQLGAFRQRVFGGKFLSDEEALVFLNSPANACFPHETFVAARVRTYSHQSEVIEGRVDAPPDTEVVIGVKPGDLEWHMKTGGTAQRLDVTHLPRWLISGHERYKVYEPRIEEEQEEYYQWGNEYPPWSPEDSEPAFDLVAWYGSVLHDFLWVAGRVIARHALGNTADWLWFLLTADPHETGPDPMTLSILQVMPGSKVFFIRLDIRPWIAADVVLTAYRQAQKNVLGQVNQPIRARNLQLFQFVTLRSWERPVPNWPQMMREWNELLPYWKDDHSEWQIDETWRWTNWKRMNNEYKSVRAKILQGFN